MLTNFTSGFVSAAEVIAWLAGIICAIALVLAIVLVLVVLAGSVFDRITNWLAARWAGRKPRNRIEAVILGRGSGTDGSV